MQMNRTVRDFERALEVLVTEKPFEKLTIDQICEEALLHRSSFYRYFHDKYDLLEQTINARLKALWQKASDEDELLEMLLQYVNEHKSFFRHLTTSGSRDSLYTELMRMSTEILMNVRENGPENAKITRALRATKNPQLVASSISGAIMGSLYWWQEQNYELADQEIVDSVKRFVNSLPQGTN